MTRANGLKPTYSSGLLQALLGSLLAALTLPGQAEPFEAFTPTPQPELILRDVNNDLHELKDYRGKVVLVNFWATWCTPCITELPELIRLQHDLRNRPLVILAINVGEREARVKQFIDSMKLTLPVLLDPDRTAFREWGGRVLPTNLLFDADGRVRYRAIGNPRWDYQPTLDLIEDLLKPRVKTELTLTTGNKKAAR